MAFTGGTLTVTCHRCVTADGRPHTFTFNTSMARAAFIDMHADATGHLSEMWVGGSSTVPPLTNHVK